MSMTMREHVARSIVGEVTASTAVGRSSLDARVMADAAILVVLDALITEAEKDKIPDSEGGWDIRYDVADWLREMKEGVAEIDAA